MNVYGGGRGPFSSQQGLKNYLRRIYWWLCFLAIFHSDTVYLVLLYEYILFPRIVKKKKIIKKQTLPTHIKHKTQLQVSRGNYSSKHCVTYTFPDLSYATRSKNTSKISASSLLIQWGTTIALFHTRFPIGQFRRLAANHRWGEDNIRPIRRGRSEINLPVNVSLIFTLHAPRLANMYLLEQTWVSIRCEIRFLLCKHLIEYPLPKWAAAERALWNSSSAGLQQIGRNPPRE